MKKPSVTILLAAGGLAAMLAAAFCAYRESQGPEKTEADAPATMARGEAGTLTFKPDAPQLSFLQIKPVASYPEPLTEALNARIVYDDNHTARVFSPIAGRVLRINTEMGRSVKAGDPLVELDSPDFSAAMADSAKADADLARKRKTYERAKQLLEIQGIAQKDVEAAEADLQQAIAEAQRAKARLHNLNAHALNARGEFTLRAPIDGMVSERLVNVGSEVRPDAAAPLFVITDPKRLWLQIDLPEHQINDVRMGQAVFIEVDAYPGETFPGRISVIGETLDPVTRRINVRCEITDKQQKLRPEMFARATPVADSRSRLPRIPNSALVTQGLYSHVFVEKAPGVLQRRRVTLSLQGREYSYIKEGLQEGERIVTSGALLLNSELAGNE